MKKSKTCNKKEKRGNSSSLIRRKDKIRVVVWCVVVVVLCVVVLMLCVSQNGKEGDAAMLSKCRITDEGRREK